MSNVLVWTAPLFLRETARVAYRDRDNAADVAGQAWQAACRDLAQYLHSHSLADTAKYAKSQRDFLNHGRTYVADYDYARPLYAAYKHATNELERWAYNG